MENLKNIIITLSGEPASGKSSVTKRLKEIYTKEGYKVHIISVGELFRKITVAEYKKKFPEIENPSIEEINSNPEFAEELKEIDFKIDVEMAKIGQEISSKYTPNEVYIVDSRLAWMMLPESFSVRLTIDSKIAGERVFNDKSRGAEDQYETLQESIEKTESRKKEEIERYKEFYGLDLSNQNNYRLIIGTTLASIEDIAQTIIKCEERFREGKPFSKTWASPELFYPTQNIRDTWEKSIYTGMNLKELAKSIQENNIYPDEPVLSRTITNNPYQFIANGHHRVFASIMAGKTLIPYKAIGNIEKAIVQSKSTIYDYEGFTKPNGEKFYYAQYPEIGQELDAYDMEL